MARVTRGTNQGREYIENKIGLFFFFTGLIRTKSFYVTALVLSLGSASTADKLKNVFYLRSGTKDLVVPHPKQRGNVSSLNNCG